MANVKISDLNAAAALTGAELVPIVQSSATVRTTATAIAALGGGAGTIYFSNPGGRLTLESGVPVSTSDQIGRGTLYYTPYLHNNIYTYSGSAWQRKAFAEISLALSITSAKNYDVFINSTATTLSLSSAWTNDTTRADALGTQDGVTVLGSDHTKLWLGTIRASGSNITADSGGGGTTQVGGQRLVWNAYNQVLRHANVIDTTSSWSYKNATVRQANGASGNKIEYVTGDLATTVDVYVSGNVLLINTLDAPASNMVGIDSTTAASGISGIALNNNASGSVEFIIPALYSGQPGLGYHYIAWLESGSPNADFCIFIGGTGNTQSGLIAKLRI